LLGQDGDDQADECVGGGEDAEDFSAVADLAVEPFGEVAEPFWRQISLANR
jgi:hypothetical protein